MSSTRSPILAGLLAIAMVTSLVPLLPTGSAAGTPAATCQPTGETQIHSEEGFVALSHPMTSDARISQALFFHVFSERNPTVFGDGLRAWTNGQDAYVIDFDCKTDGQEWVCIEHEEPAPTEGFPILAQQPDGSPPDVRLQFYTAAQTQIGDEKNPEPDREDEDCIFDVPSAAQYAVVYLRDGVPEGVQFAEQLFGPYAMDFAFEMHRS